VAYTCTRLGYYLGMASDVVVRIPRPLAEQLDRQAKDQLRSRSNLAAWLIKQGLQAEPAESGRN
jgi:metal-responsive CopG/Arc/MetJ family transcriptional regulator